MFTISKLFFPNLLIPFSQLFISLIVLTVKEKVLVGNHVCHMGA
jgi:hypothetical protein